ncbi:unnamed protein product [Callosobruchus maculatus]|uniref:Uncharacterized protein n=1 Tax=Callosobruchus maculatus TaxID=64391 RepID=A0A653C5J8_CALMS|nr:unnamed protein product [Callosobruchus maculatus]
MAKILILCVILAITMATDCAVSLFQPEHVVAGVRRLEKRVQTDRPTGRHTDRQTDGRK